MLDRVTERRRAAQLARHYRDQEDLSIAEIARRLGRPEASIKTYLYDPTGDKARAVKARYPECVAAAGRPPRHGTARATPTRIANAAIPARLRRNGPGNGFARRCAPGERATALRRPRTTGRARTHAGAAAKRSNDYRPENGPRRPLSSICTGAGRRPSPTPSAARERLGVNAGEMRTRRLRLASVNGSAEGRRERFCHSSSSDSAGVGRRLFCVRVIDCSGLQALQSWGFRCRRGAALRPTWLLRRSSGYASRGPETLVCVDRFLRERHAAGGCLLGSC